MRPILACVCLSSLVGVAVLLAADPEPAAVPEPRSRDVFPEDVAGNDDVERIIHSFEGRGAVGDDSRPTSAEEAVTQFVTADDLQIELVAAEPAVEQPLDLHFDDRGRMWVVQYRQYPFPAGLKVIRYDQYLRAVFDKVPQPPPNHTPGADKITVFEDTDGDGKYDTSKDVITGLNIATSVCTGHGGIWVLNPPYLLFYPDANRDDVPDADPEVRLSGFGLEDTHSVANNLRWGPDGWLYGANGSTTTGNVSSDVTRNVRFQGQCIWRYHPDSRVFEIYAEGGGNTFSTEIDAAGRVFSGTNAGNTRGMYYPQGSYGEKGWGKHGPLTNPFAFGYFRHMRHEGDQDRFPQTFVIYEGGLLPARYNRTIIAANALHNRVWASELFDDGSTYRTKDLPPIVTTPDRWFRPVDVEVGPDGAVYIADWYDTRLTHVDPRDNWHKTSGRIYRLSGREADGTQPQPALPPRAKSPVAFDLDACSSDGLIGLFQHPNKWLRQTAARVLGERLIQSRDAESITALAAQAESGSLEALWALHWCGAAGEEQLRGLLANKSPDIRRWAVRLLGDQRAVDVATAAPLVELAAREQYVQVRSQLASSARRFSAAVGVPILSALAAREEDAADPHLPLLIWWGLEGHSGAEPMAGPQLGVALTEPDAVAPRDVVLRQFEDEIFWQHALVRQSIAPRLMQRWGLEAVTTDHAASAAGCYDACARLLTLAPTDELRGGLIAGFLEAYEGRAVAGLPETLATAIGDYQSRLGESDVALALRLGQADAIPAALAVVADDNAAAPLRLSYIALLGSSKSPTVVAPLLALIDRPAPAIKRAAMEALLSFDDPQIGATICNRYHSSIPDEHGLRSTAQRVLAARAVWTRQFLQEIEEFRIKPATVPLDVVQQMRLHPDSDIQSLLDKHWGRTRATSEEKQSQIARVRALLASGGRQPAGETLPITSSASAEPLAGRELFRKHCGVCHTLFDEGGQTGPKLTGYERDNLDFMLTAIIDPSAAIREEFTQFQVVTHDGLVLNGLLDDQTPTTLTLRGANNQSTVLNRDDVEILQAVETSLMPDALLDKLTDAEVRQLFAYITRRTPLAGAAAVEVSTVPSVE
jgi:putative heme-binding domain-containing protein